MPLEKLWFSGVFSGFEIVIFARNRCDKSEKDSHYTITVFGSIELNDFLSKFLYVEAWSAMQLKRN